MHRVAVVVPTTLRPSLLRAVQSIFRQSLNDPFQILIGLDVANGDRAMLDQLRDECPPHIRLTILDLGYSTSARHGGFYPNSYSGALRTILSYAADSAYVAYLDDDDWWAKDHLSSLLATVEGRDWAFSYRWMTDPETGWAISRDDWDSVGPGRGINHERFGGFCCPSTLILNKQTCHFVFPQWSLAMFSDGGGEDRLVFTELLKSDRWASSGRYTCYYQLPTATQIQPHHAAEFACRSVRWVADRSLIPNIQQLADEARQAADQEDLVTAIGLAGRALDMHPNHAGCLYLLAKAFLRLNRTDEAVEALRKAYEADPFDPAIANSWHEISNRPDIQKRWNLS